MDSCGMVAYKKESQPRAAGLHLVITYPTIRALCNNLDSGPGSVSGVTFPGQNDRIGILLNDLKRDAWATFQLPVAVFDWAAIFLIVWKSVLPEPNWGIVSTGIRFSLLGFAMLGRSLWLMTS